MSPAFPQPGSRDEQMAFQKVGIDTGGTFTDAVTSDGQGGFQIHKRPTTPREPARAVLSALQELTPAGRFVPELIHGTTHATNALLTGRVGRTVFVTTAGFADVLAIGRQDRPQLYDLQPRPPRPPQPRRRIVEVHERMAFDGQPIEALHDDELERVVAAVRRLRPQSIAIGLLHAYREPRHERRLADALARLGVPVISSSEIAPEYREYERFTTTWADAALCPVVGPALRQLGDELCGRWGPQARLRIMRSDGGICAAEAAAAHPVHLALSGPAGGLSAARSLADARGDRAVLTLDMGGTSTDVALLGEEELPLLPMELAGLPLLARGLPLHSVGTGGGSLARKDAGGALTVGPESAGAEPGPVCYRRGGKRATVTDAHLVAGRLHPQAFLGGEFELDDAAARAAIEELGSELGLDAQQVATGILEVATAEMERAVRRVSLAEGHDPASLVLYSFGGAGGLHAAWLADRLGIPTVVAPPSPGAFSAIGLMGAPARRTLARSVLEVLPDRKTRSTWFEPLVEQATEALVAEGLSRRSLHVRRVLELRGEGQAGEFAIPEGPRALERFHERHRARFGFSREEHAVILVAVRVQVDGPSESPWIKHRVRRHAAKSFEQRRAHMPETEWRGRVAWYRREEMMPGAFLNGPAVVSEYSATTVVPPGWEAHCDGFGALELRRARTPRRKR